MILIVQLEEQFGTGNACDFQRLEGRLLTETRKRRRKERLRRVLPRKCQQILCLGKSQLKCLLQRRRRREALQPAPPPPSLGEAGSWGRAGAIPSPTALHQALPGGCSSLFYLSASAQTPGGARGARQDRGLGSSVLAALSLLLGARLPPAHPRFLTPRELREGSGRTEPPRQRFTKEHIESAQP